MKTVVFWISVFTVALLIFAGLCWLDMRPVPTLHSAAASGNLPQAAKLLASGADPDAPDQEGFSPAMRAVQSRQVEVLELLLQSGAKVDFQGAGGNTAVHLAVLTGDLRSLEKLIAAGADLQRRNGDKVTPLYLAVKNNSPAVEMLVKAGALPADFTCADESYLLSAARSGCRVLVDILIERGVDLTVRSATGACALHYAVNRGHVDVVHVLLDHGANVDAKDRYDWTPLHHAVRGDRVEIARMLLAHGANTELRGHRGRTPLQMAAQLGYVGIFEVLARGGADINAKSLNDETAEELARDNRHPEILTFLSAYRREFKERQLAAGAPH